jgi:hypothetical protein
MADLERIAPPVPTLPTPIGRNVGSKRRRPSERDHKPEPEPPPAEAPRRPEPDHIDEYV